MNETIAALVTWKEETAQNMNHFYLVIMGILVYCKYTETIKLCPLDVYVCQFQMDQCISFKFSPYIL